MSLHDYRAFIARERLSEPAPPAPLAAGDPVSRLCVPPRLADAEGGPAGVPAPALRAPLLGYQWDHLRALPDPADEVGPGDRPLLRVGCSARALAQELCVIYKTAWRLLTTLRTVLPRTRS